MKTTDKEQFNDDSPLVSIIIPTYNRAYLIGETFDSIIAQHYENWECIIIDDGSTDQTEEIVSKYILKDKRFKYYKRPTSLLKGGNSCRNYGLEKSNGKFINWFDSDDLMKSNKLLVQVNQLQESKCDFVICQSVFFENQIENLKGTRHTLSSSNNLESYINGTIAWSTIAPIWKKEFLVKNNIRFNEFLKAGQEWSYHCRALLSTDKYIINEESLVFIRVHKQNITNNLKNTCDRLYHYYLSRKEIHDLITTKNYDLFFNHAYTLIYKKLIDAKCYANSFKMLLDQTLITKRLIVFLKLLFFSIIYIVSRKGKKYIKF
jgi:glycosyltransferase involved in cell wall biosynthesis